jgi:hypothetical protein
MPTNTDLVSQLPADFEVFGQAVDTSLADLKGGTTGQVLKKNTDSDMDFVWAADSAGMTNPMTTTGDTIYSSSGSTPARLGIGSTGNVLTVSGGVPVWEAPAGGGKLLQMVTSTYSTTVTNTSGSYVDTGLTATITPTAATSKITVMVTHPTQFYNSTTTTAVAGYYKLLRGATALMGDGSNNQMISFTGASAADLYLRLYHTFIFIDSPSTTSATTYKTQLQDVNQIMRSSFDNSVSTMTLFEIGA